MYELAMHIEIIAMKFSPIVLLVPGVVLTILGIFVWLGGFGLRKILISTIAAAAGFIMGMLSIGENVIVAIALAIVMAIISLYFERFFIATLAAALTALTAFTISAFINLENPSGLIQMDFKAIENAQGTLSTQQTMAIVNALTEDLKAISNISLIQTPNSIRILVSVITVMMFWAGYLFKRGACAISCAFAGALSIFIGMSLLLLYKGAAIIHSMANKWPFYVAAFAIMVAFGVLIQIIIAPVGPRKQKKKSKDENEEQIKENWRTV